jgi:transposase
MKRRKFTSKFKTKVVLESLKELHPLSDLAQKYEVSPTQISGWKKAFLSNAESVFGPPAKGGGQMQDAEKDRLLRIIGELKVENDFLKKNLV